MSSFQFTFLWTASFCLVNQQTLVKLPAVCWLLCCMLGMRRWMSSLLLELTEGGVGVRWMCHYHTERWVWTEYVSGLNISGSISESVIKGRINIGAKWWIVGRKERWSRVKELGALISKADLKTSMNLYPTYAHRVSIESGWDEAGKRGKARLFIIYSLPTLCWPLF